MAVRVMGQALVGDSEVVRLDGNPSLAPGVKAPISSFGLVIVGGVGQWWGKFGPADTDWVQIVTAGGPGAADWALAGNVLTGGTPTTPNEIMGSRNNFDVVFVRNNPTLTPGVGEIYRLQSDAVAGWNSIRQVIDPTSLAGTPAFVSRMAFPKVTTVGAVSTTVDIPIPLGYAGMVESKISARTAAGGTIGFVRTDQVSNPAGVVANPFFQNDYTYAPGLETVTAAPSAGNLRLTLTGSAGNTYRWFVASELVIVNT